MHFAFLVQTAWLALYARLSILTTIVAPMSSGACKNPWIIDRNWKPPPWRATDFGGGAPYHYNSDTSPWTAKAKTCEVKSGNPSGDDTAAILSAFADCREDGHILFHNTTYYVQHVMNTTGLKNVDIELLGTLEWPANQANIEYWLKNSLPIGYQNQSAAWLLGGENVRFFGYGYGTLFGNGDDWYIFNNGVPNRAGRPHAISFYGMTNSLVSGIRFIKSQMWTATVTRSENVELIDIYVNNSCSAEAARRVDYCNINTDGVDTIYANNITFLRWTVECGDDSISIKQDSTNIYMANNTFVKGLAYAIGSIGQYTGEFHVIENITAVDTYLYDTRNAGYIKTWSGVPLGSPPNGGGGGLGYARNISFTNFTIRNVEMPWYITQCTYGNGNCDTSLFKVSNIHWGNTTGTTRSSTIATLQCSGAVNCTDIEIFENDLTVQNTGTKADRYLCKSVQEPRGFNCTGGAST